MDFFERTIIKEDNNIRELRAKYPGGLHFVVGDTHGEGATLIELMKKIEFDPEKDHVYFVGDYTGGGYQKALMDYISRYYTEDYLKPGFHLIRGNHERELDLSYPLANMPDIIVLRGRYLNYYIVHAGMVERAFNLINRDMDAEPEKKVYAYRLDNSICGHDRPFRQLTWSRNGLYSQISYYHTWPSEENLHEHRACIIHGHSPYSYFMDEKGYGDNGVFFRNQHVWFSEALQSFNLDSDVKGRNKNGENYRGLACLCLEVTEEIAASCGGKLTTGGIRTSQNGLFGVPISYQYEFTDYGTLQKMLTSKPEMKTIRLDDQWRPYIE